MAYSLEETKHMNGICFKILENNSNIDINNIFFGCALKYILLGQKGLKGQGDKNEGIIARYRKQNPFGINRIKKYIKHFGKKNLIIQENNGFYEIRRRSSLLTPMACFFSMIDDFSNEVSNITDYKTHIITKQHTIENKFFRAFKKNKDDKLKWGDFVIINYENDRMLYKKVTNELQKSDVKKQNVILKEIEYLRNGFDEWECPEYIKMGLDVNLPYELFYKDKEFSYQNEHRIVVNDKKWIFNTKYYYDEMLKVFYNSGEQLNKYINVSENSIFNIANSKKEIEGGITIKLRVPITAHEEN